jgi:hypothetical protein
VAASCLSDAAAGKMDDVLVAKLFSGNHWFCSAIDLWQWRVWLSSASRSARTNVVHGTLRPTSSFWLPRIRMPGPSGVRCHGSACIRPCTGN